MDTSNIHPSLFKSVSAVLSEDITLKWTGTFKGFQVNKLLKGWIWTNLWLCCCFPLKTLAVRSVEAYQLKAIFVYNFAHFFTFPKRQDNSSKQFTFCTYGDSQFKQALQLVLKETTFVGEAPRLIDLDIDNRPSVCQIIFFPKSETSRYPYVLARLKTLPILTVSYIAGFAERGGIIEFVRSGNKIKLH